MKRLFILASAAIVALASCTKTQVVYTEAPAEIGVQTYASAMTKADLGESVHLGVFAEWVNTSDEVSSYFDNKDFSKQSGVWKGGQYWPKEGSLNFTFYAPYMESGADYNDGTKTLTLTIPDNSDSQTDYLVGSTRPMNETYVADQAVDIVLQHALASVKVTAVADKDIYKLTTVTLNDTKQAGKLDFVYEADGTSYEASVNGEATGEKDFTLVNAPTAVPLTAAAVGNENGYLVFPSTSTSLTIEYTINGAAQTKTVNLGETWVSGKQYTYAISFTSYEITVAPTVVNSWEVGTVTTNTTIQ